MKLAENVIMMPIPREGASALHLVLVYDDNNRVLIDAGLPGQFDEIALALKEHGFVPEDLTHLVLTHQDLDHIGIANDLLKLAPKLKIIAHSEEAPYIDGRKLPIKLEEKLQKLDSLSDSDKQYAAAYKASYEENPIMITDEVHDGEVYDICGGLEFVHVPGHTPGHIAVYLIKSKIIVCGDAANINNEKLIGSNPIYTQDMSLADKSLDKIKSYDLIGYVAYHGGFLKTQCR